jgi:hypothetical protein
MRGVVNLCRTSQRKSQKRKRPNLYLGGKKRRKLVPAFTKIPCDLCWMLLVQLVSFLNTCQLLPPKNTMMPASPFLNKGELLRLRSSLKASAQPRTLCKEFSRLLLSKALD